MIPAAVPGLVKAGLEVAVEQGRERRPASPTRRTARRAPRVCRAPSSSRPPTSCSRSARRRLTRRCCGPGRRSSASPIRLAPRRRSASVARDRRDALLDGADAAHHARAEHGRAVVDGDDCRLQGRAARRDHAAAHVPDADDRRRHDLARARVHHGRRRRRPAGDLDRAPPRREGRGVRRAAGGQGAGPEPRREVRRAAARVGGRRGQGRLRQGAGRGVLQAAARDDAEGRRGERRRHHDGADPGQAGADSAHDARWSRRWRPARSSSISRPSAAATAS